MKIRVINESHHNFQNYSAPLPSGISLKADNEEDMVLKPQWKSIVKTGLFLEMPAGYEANINQEHKNA